jgi:hypothetical protein
MSATARATRPSICLIAGLAIVWHGIAHAATVTGKVVAVDAATRSLEVSGRGEETTSFVVADTARIQVSGKPGTLDTLVAGQTVTLTTDGDGVVTAVRAGKPPRDAARTSQRAAAGGWPQYGGANRDGRAADTGLVTSWPEG